MSLIEPFLERREGKRMEEMMEDMEGEIVPTSFV